MKKQHCKVRDGSTRYARNNISYKTKDNQYYSTNKQQIIHNFFCYKININIQTFAKNNYLCSNKTKKL